MTRVPGRLLAWTSVVFGLGVSLAANVAQARPSLGPQLAAAAVPCLVILAAGLLERVPLAGIPLWQRLLAYPGLSIIVVAAFIASFEHQQALLRRYGNSALSSALLPVAVDGLVVLGSVCLTVIAEQQRTLAVKPVHQVDTIPEMTAPVSDTVSDTATPAEQPKRPVRKPRKSTSPKDRAVRLHESDPNMSVSVIAKRVGRSERMVHRYLDDAAAVAPVSDTTPVDGHAVPELVEVTR